MADIEKTIEELKRTEQFLTEYGFDGHIQQVHDAIELLKEQEAKEQISDAIHETAKQFRQTIVRCKDCKNLGYTNSHWFCKWLNRCVDEDWFCADGEKRTD